MERDRQFCHDSSAHDSRRVSANGVETLSRLAAFVVGLILVGFICGCGRPPGGADDNSSNSSSNSSGQKLPFDRQPGASGISPSRSLVPSAKKLPEGTPLPVRLHSTLSSASSHAGDTFNAILDEPVVVDGQTLIARGTGATGRVLEAKPGDALEPGYLRIVLVSLNLEGRRVTIETSSIFAKGGHRDARNQAPSVASGGNPRDRDIVFGTDRRFNFRLAQTIDLQ